MTTLGTFAAGMAAIIVIGTALAGLHDAVARIIERERQHRIRKDAARTIGGAIPLYRTRR